MPNKNFVWIFLERENEPRERERKKERATASEKSIICAADRFPKVQSLNRKEEEKIEMSLFGSSATRKKNRKGAHN